MQIYTFQINYINLSITYDKAIKCSCCTLLYFIVKYSNTSSSSCSQPHVNLLIAFPRLLANKPRVAQTMQPNPISSNNYRSLPPAIQVHRARIHRHSHFLYNNNNLNHIIYIEDRLFIVACTIYCCTYMSACLKQRVRALTSCRANKQIKQTLVYHINRAIN